jgi:hypothetical protein
VSETQAERAAAPGTRRIAIARVLVPIGGVIVPVETHVVAMPLALATALIAVATRLLSSIAAVATAAKWTSRSPPAPSCGHPLAGLATLALRPITLPPAARTTQGGSRRFPR